MPRLPRPSRGSDIRDERPDCYDATGRFPNLHKAPGNGAHDRQTAERVRSARWRAAALPVGFGVVAAVATLAFAPARHEAQQQSEPRSRQIPATPTVTPAPSPQPGAE